MDMVIIQAVSSRFTAILGYRLTISDYHFLAFDFCWFCIVIGFFHPRHNDQRPPTSKDFLSQILSITFIFLS